MVHLLRPKQTQQMVTIPGLPQRMALTTWHVELEMGTTASMVDLKLKSLSPVLKKNYFILIKGP